MTVLIRGSNRCFRVSIMIGGEAKGGDATACEEGDNGGAVNGSRITEF